MRRLMLVALAAGVLAAGCGDDEDNPVAPAGTARVMVVHASPDAPAVDLLIDGVVVSPGLAFPNNTGYLTVNAGTRHVTVNLAGTALTVAEADLPVTENVTYSVFAIDSALSADVLVVIDLITPPAAGQAHVRFAHLSPNAQPVDLAVQGGAVVFADQAYEEYTAFTALAAGTYDLEVRQAGTSTVLVPVNDITFEAGKSYTVFTRGFVGGAGAQALGASIIVND